MEAAGKRKNNANQLEPGWEKLEARCRETLESRMMLIPYLRAAFARYQADGTPSFRALVMEDSLDAAPAECDDQFMIGDRMMVAPMFAGETSRKVILPRGEWYDFWTGHAIAGGQTITVPSTYERIPVYMKNGSVMPLGGVANSTAEPATRDLVVRIVGDGSLPFSIGSKGQRELLLTWQKGNGIVEQHRSSRPY